MLKDAIKNKEDFTNQRDTLGMSIREWEARGGHWRLQVLFALLVEAMNRNDVSGNVFLSCFQEYRTNYL